MGNSVRSTLGNLCGGQQALADFDENERPVSKPKESKKKEKKLKRNKKEKNGDLPPVPEGSEEKVLPETPVVETEPINEQNDVSTNDETPKDNTENSSRTEVKGTRKVLSVYDNVDDDEPAIHSEEKKFEGKILDNESAEGVEELNKNVSTGSSSDRKKDEIVIPEQQKNEDENTIQRKEDSGQNEEKSEIEIEKSIDEHDEQDESQAESFGNKEGNDGKVNYIYKVEPIKPELLGISYADKIFSNAAEIYEPFFHSNEKFKHSLHEFEDIVNHEKGNSDFKSCLRNYQEFCTSEVKRDTLKDLRGENAKVDISDMNASLQNVRSTGIILLQDIERVRPAFDKVFSSAGTVDVVDYVKGTVADGDQLGITSKFSAPGKCRRNMLQLKKGVKLLDGVEKEIKNIMNLIESQQNVEMKLVGNKNLRLNSPCDFSTETPSRHAINNEDDKVQDYDEESVIIPSPVKVDNINMIEKLSTLPQLENDVTVPEKKSDEFSNLTAADTSDQTPAHQEFLQQAKTEERPESPEAKTYIIENIPEEFPKSPPKANLPERESPKLILPPLGLPHTKSATVKSPVTQLVVEEEDHSILDFGKYVFIDPSTGDIQVMRNRSRSLDSLVSMTSNRSSLSRFGSFELVTDFEINIAEKNQQSFLSKE